MPRIIIYPYKIGSASARNLAESLSSREGITAFRVRSSSPLKRRPNRIILNWGNSNSPDWPVAITNILFNSFDAVDVAANKLLAFEELKRADLPIPEFTTDKEEAEEWLDAGFTIVERSLLRGHSGEGIRVVTGEEEAPTCYLNNVPLYVKYKKKKHEFRVHVFGGDVIDIQQKKRERGVVRDGEQQKIRNRANGWVFCREDLDLSLVNTAKIEFIAEQAIQALSLDFGAVDIIYNEREDQFYVLEVNTAPGLEGSTLERYTDAIVKYVTS